MFPFAWKTGVLETTTTTTTTTKSCQVPFKEKIIEGLAPRFKPYLPSSYFLTGQAFDLTTTWYLPCWMVESTMICIWFRHPNECNNWPHLTVADIVHHQWTCAFTYLEHFVRNPPAFRSVPMLYLVDQTWRPLFWFLAWTIICDILIGWSCSSDWHLGSPCAIVSHTNIETISNTALGNFCGGEWWSAHRSSQALKYHQNKVWRRWWLSQYQVR